jgi:hypothetical protein
MTRPQKTFEAVIKRIEKKTKSGYNTSFCRYYHDEQSVSVDGELHSILNGYSDFLGCLREEIDNALSSIGYFMENQNGCDFKFYKI